MRKERGLTLVELAIVLIVLGILLGIGAGLIGVLIKRVKYSESKEIVNAAVEGIIGYAIATGKLPDSSTWSTAVRSTVDSYGKPLAYVYDSNLTSNGAICSQSETNITIRICSNATCSPDSYIVQTISNVAFMVISGNGNYNNQTARTQGVTSATTIDVYKYGVDNVDNYSGSGDMNRSEPYDDIVKWVSLYELKTKVNCPGAGSGGGSGSGDCNYNGYCGVQSGGCSSNCTIQFANLSNSDVYITGGNQNCKEVKKNKQVNIGNLDPLSVIYVYSNKKDKDCNNLIDTITLGSPELADNATLIWTGSYKTCVCP